ncbi:hypothetical protein FF38_00491 [Lucilia cuprina]|uniref:Transmembrane protein n=1 Tax=Lucilia cuprina TaxID=7375 RepID=A0A0L0CJS4_LUCCU|nr:hypothetical protein FF38_00491 [Lucilia cuprina]
MIGICGGSGGGGGVNKLTSSSTASITSSAATTTAIETFLIATIIIIVVIILVLIVIIMVGLVGVIIVAKSSTNYLHLKNLTHLVFVVDFATKGFLGLWKRCVLVFADLGLALKTAGILLRFVFALGSGFLSLMIEQFCFCCCLVLKFPLGFLSSTVEFCCSCLGLVVSSFLNLSVFAGNLRDVLGLLSSFSTSLGEFFSCCFCCSGLEFSLAALAALIAAGNLRGVAGFVSSTDLLCCCCGLEFSFEEFSKTKVEICETLMEDFLWEAIKT